MNIPSIGAEGGTSPLLDEVGARMLSKALKGAQEEATELMKSVGGRAPLAEESGENLDILA